MQCCVAEMSRRFGWNSDQKQEPAIIQSASNAAEVSAGSPGFCRDAVDVFALLGCYVPIVGSLLPPFQFTLSIEDGADIVCPNAGNQIPIYTGQNPRRTNTSARYVLTEESLRLLKYSP